MTLDLPKKIVIFIFGKKKLFFEITLCLILSAVTLDNLVDRIFVKLFRVYN